MKMQIRDRIDALRRVYPRINNTHARYLHKKPEDLQRRGKIITVYLLLWSDDGRVSIHRSIFKKTRTMSVIEWAGWLQVNGPLIFINSVLPYVNRTFSSSWNIETVIGWHFGRKK